MKGNNKLNQCKAIEARLSDIENPLYKDELESLKSTYQALEADYEIK